CYEKGNRINLPNQKRMCQTPQTKNLLQLHPSTTPLSIRTSAVSSPSKKQQLTNQNGQCPSTQPKQLSMLRRTHRILNPPPCALILMGNTFLQRLLIPSQLILVSIIIPWILEQQDTRFPN